MPAENARVLEIVLSGQPHASTPAFILNAAAALVVFDGLAPRLAADRAREAIESGAALKTLETFRASARKAREKVG
jgi:anthranilate phosphoribosyltransferase